MLLRILRDSIATPSVIIRDAIPISRPQIAIALIRGKPINRSHPDRIAMPQYQIKIKIKI